MCICLYRYICVRCIVCKTSITEKYTFRYPTLSGRRCWPTQAGRDTDGYEAGFLYYLLHISLSEYVRAWCLYRFSYHRTPPQVHTQCWYLAFTSTLQLCWLWYSSNVYATLPSDPLHSNAMNRIVIEISRLLIVIKGKVDGFCFKTENNEWSKKRKRKKE